MASQIWIKLKNSPIGNQTPLKKCSTANTSPNKPYLNIQDRVIIAKDNIIEGIKAEE